MKIEIINNGSVKSVIGSRLQAAREYRHIKRSDFCVAVSAIRALYNGDALNQKNEFILNPDTLKQWELGNNKIDIEWIPYICRVLECDVSYLFGETLQETREKDDIYTATGLSREAVDNFSSIKKELLLPVLDSLLGNSLFIELLEHIEKAKEYSKPINFEQVQKEHDEVISLAGIGSVAAKAGNYDDAISLMAEYAADSVVLSRKDAARFELQEVQSIIRKLAETYIK